MKFTKLQSVLRIYINKARWLFLSWFWPHLNLMSFLKVAGVSCVNWLKPKIDPPPADLACPNPWNTLYRNKPNRNLGSISPTFYTQLFCTQIPNAQQRQSSHQCLFALLGTTSVKASRKMLMKSTPEQTSTTLCGFTNL